LFRDCEQDVEQCLAAGLEKEQKQHDTIARLPCLAGSAQDCSPVAPPRRDDGRVGQPVRLQVRQTDRQIALA